MSKIYIYPNKNRRSYQHIVQYNVDQISKNDNKSEPFYFFRLKSL